VDEVNKNIEANLLLKLQISSHGLKEGGGGGGGGGGGTGGGGGAVFKSGATNARDSFGVDSSD